MCSVKAYSHALTEAIEYINFQILLTNFSHIQWQNREYMHSQTLIVNDPSNYSYIYSIRCDCAKPKPKPKVGEGTYC